MEPYEAIVDTAEPAKRFGSDIPDLNVWKRGHVLCGPDGDDEEMWAVGFRRNVQRCLDQCVCRHDSKTAYPPFRRLQLDMCEEREEGVTVSVGELISNSSVEGM